MFPTLIFKFAYIPLHTRNIIDTSIFLQGRGRKTQEIKKEDEDHGERTAHGRARKGTVRWLGWGRACRVPQRGDTETHSKGEGMSTSNAARIQKLNGGKQREEGNHRIPHSCSPQPPQWREAITPSIAHPQTPVRNVPKCL